MLTITKILRLINWILLLYLSTVIILALNGNVTFGYGLGDLIFIVILVIVTMLYLILILCFKQARFTSYQLQINLVLGIIYLLIAILTTYEITLGRGPENSWKGNIL